MPPEADIPTLIILDGDPGTGKTTWASKFRLEHPNEVTYCNTLAQALQAIEGRYSKYVILDPEGKLPFNVESHRFHVKPTTTYFVDRQIEDTQFDGHW